MKGIFVGCNKTSKSYTVSIPGMRKTILNRDIKFEKGQTFKKSSEPILVET